MRVALLAITVIVGAALVGCEATARSDRGEPRGQTTASCDCILAAATQPAPVRHRAWPTSHLAYQPCTVTHFGSYFDNEFVIDGDGDDAYGWTAMDLVAFGYCPARFVLNTLAVPVSMIKEPPGVLQTSNLDVDDETVAPTAANE